MRFHRLVGGAAQILLAGALVLGGRPAFGGESMVPPPQPDPATQATARELVQTALATADPSQRASRLVEAILLLLKEPTYTSSPPPPQFDGLDFSNQTDPAEPANVMLWGFEIDVDKDGVSGMPGHTGVVTTHRFGDKIKLNGLASGAAFHIDALRPQLLSDGDADGDKYKSFIGVGRLHVQVTVDGATKALMIDGGEDVELDGFYYRRGFFNHPQNGRPKLSLTTAGGTVTATLSGWAQTGRGSPAVEVVQSKTFP